MNTTGIARLTESIENMLKEGRFTVDGSTEVTDIRRVERDGDHIRVFLYLPASDNAQTVTKVELIDDRGQVIDEKNDIMEKPARKGLMVAFDYTISEVS
ncbi:MAG: hypothetical protein PWR10_1528 [Halanaerobiales bacterium]|nr:hypothetical protein [Halanaerobiales bacterium]